MLDDEDPALAAANQQIQAMGQEMEQMHQMLKQVSQSMEARDIQIKEFEAQTRAKIDEYNAETNRIKAVQAGMSPEQIQDIVMGTLAAAMDSGDLAGAMPQMSPESVPMEMGEPYEMQ
jgi:septal ring factor EnvC (AmiA/AmiB activator)